MDIGEKLKKIRIEKGLSLRELGRRINISYSYLSRIENGKQKPHLDLLESLSKTMNVHISDFFIDESKSTFNETEKDVLSRKDVTKEFLKDNYELEEDVTDEQLEEMIRLYKTFRQMNRSPN